MASDVSALVTETTPENIESALEKRTKVGESLIQGFLFICGVLSIFTTLGIVVILGNESRNFFTNTLWEDTNKRILADIGATDTSIPLTTSGTNLEVGDVVRIHNELMEITAIDETAMTVVRGLDNDATQYGLGDDITAAIEHNAGAEIRRATKVSLRETVSETRWLPQLGNFGIWPLLLATLMTSLIAMVIALPTGLATAIYLSEYASPRARNILKPILEILAGIPTVVYGYFALTFMTPLLAGIFESRVLTGFMEGIGRRGIDVGVFNVAAAGIVVGILIIPMVSSLSEDALHAVPNSLRQAAYGLGATKLETATRVVLPAALSGITAAFVIAISRAVGETMIVAVAAGSGPRNFTGLSGWLADGNAASDWYRQTPFNPFISAETITGHIVRISKGDISYDSIDYNSIFALGLLLFLMTLTLNIVSRRIVTRFREVYE